MDSPDQSGAVKRIIKILKKITRIVQLLPFLYLLLLSGYLLTESLLPDWSLRIADNAMYTSVPTMVGFLGVGRILKLCKWFKTACVLPIATKIESYIDSFVITFTQGEVIIINVALGIMFISYIYLAYRHFFHGRRS